MGCHFLFQGIFLTQGLNSSLLYPALAGENHLRTTIVSEVAQSCPTLCDPIDGGPPGSPVHGILQARTLEWVAISFSMKIFRK